MDKEILTACYKKSIQLQRKESATKVFSEVMKKHNIPTQAALARLIGCEPQYISEMKVGKKPMSKKIVDGIINIKQLLLDRKKVEEYR